MERVIVNYFYRRKLSKFPEQMYQRIKAKSLQVSADESEQVASNGISSIREQLDQMRTILKGANFKSNHGFESQKNDKQDPSPLQ